MSIKETELVVSQFRPTCWPDGQPTTSGTLMGYNAQVPGPQIRATEGDTVVVTVRNDLDVPTTVHWHGMHQRGSWFYDGVNMITQAPIQPGGCFKYTFKAEPHGSHWYHSHKGVQYSEGLFGPLIIEEADNPYEGDYDSDRVVVINDWFHESSESILEGLEDGTIGDDDSSGCSTGGMTMDVGDVPFESALINGKGRYEGSNTQLEVFPVESGERIRFRLINCSSTYAFKFAIDDHKLAVIASDGMLTQEKEVDSLVVNISERYDVIVRCDRPIGNYWMRACTLEQDEQHCAQAILRYRGASDEDPDTSLDWGQSLSLMELKPFQESPAPAATRTHKLELAGSMKPYEWMIRVDDKLPAKFGLPELPIPECAPPPDPPTTTIRIAENEVVRLVLNNSSMMGHPFHLHGHSFQVLGQGMMKAGSYQDQPLNTRAPVSKDVIDVPMSSWAVIQFRSDNPGWWFFHCHIEWHLATGMAVVFQASDPPAPPIDVGECS